MKIKCLSIIWTLTSLILLDSTTSSARDYNFPPIEQARLDSFLSIIEVHAHDTGVAKAYVGLSEIYYGANPDTLMDLCEMAMEIVHRNIESAAGDILLSYETTKGIALNNMGHILQMRGKSKEAMENYKQCLIIHKKHHNAQGLSFAYTNIGFLYSRQGLIEKAIEFYHKGLSMADSINDQKGAALALNNIAFIYEQQDDRDKAMEYLRRSLKEAREINDLKHQGLVLMNIGEIYQEWEQYKECIQHFKLGLATLRESKYLAGTAYCLGNLGSVNLEIHEYEKAEKYLGEAMEIFTSIQSVKGTLHVKGYLGLVYIAQGRIEEALQIGTELLDTARVHNYIGDIERGAGLLDRVYRSYGQWEKALEMYELEIQMGDSLKNDKTQKATIRQQTKYEFEKDQLVKEQAEKDHKRVLLEAENRRNNLQYTVILIGLLLLFGGILSMGFLKISERMAEGVIFFSFLIFFEFLLVLADPTIESWSSGAPGIKLLFNAGIAALIFPLHAFFEAYIKRRILK